MKKEEKELIRLIQSDPEQGIEECIRRYGGDVKAICRNILRDHFSGYVEDAVVETFTALWQQLQKKQRIKTTLQGYLYGIARMKALEMIRKNKPPEKQLSVDDEGVEALLEDCHVDVESAFARRYNERLVHQVIAEMKEPDRSIFLLRYFYFYKVREIAEIMSIQEDNVESRLRRGKGKLRQRLEEKGIM